MSIRDKFKHKIAIDLCDHPRIKYLNVVLLDLDNFIYHNDAFGHASGDEALAKILDSLSSVSQKLEANVERVGGDEFMLYSLSSIPDSHTELGKQAQTGVNQLCIPITAAEHSDGNPGLPKHITCCVAAIAFPTDKITSAVPGETDRVIKDSILEGLFQLLETMCWLSKCSRYGNYVELNLC